MSKVKTKFKTTKGKEFDIAEAFPPTLGFLEDLENSGVALDKLEKKNGKNQALLPKEGMALFKVVLSQCGLTKEEIRQVSALDIQAISEAVQELMNTDGVNSGARPT